MRRLLLRIGFPVIAVVFALLGAAFTTPLLISADELRRSVAIEVAALAGQPVTISGSSRFVMLPWPTLTVENVQVGGDRGTVLVEAAGIEARLGFWSFLRGRTEVVGLQLVRPRINLAIDRRGRSNWRSGASLLSLIVADTSASGERPARPSELVIRGGTILFRDEQSGRRSELTDVDLAISWPSFGSRLTTNGRILLRGEELRFAGMVDRPSALFTRDITAVELSLETQALRASVTGNALAAADIQIEGRLTFTSPSLRRLAGWLVPEAENAPDLGPIEGAARLKILDRSMTLDDARLVVARSRGEGALTMTFDSTRTSMQGTMDFDTVDIRPFLAIQLAAADAEGLWSAVPIRGSGIGPVDVDLRVSADSLTTGQTTIRTAALSVIARDGRTEVSLGDGQAFGGRVSGRLVTEGRDGGGVRMRATMAANNFRADDALRELFGIIRVSGTASMVASLAGEGQSVREIAGGLQGEATVRLANGSLAGIDLATLVRRAERSPVDALLEARGGRSPVEGASATFRIAEGSATTDDAQIAGPGYRIGFRGAADLAQRQLAFSGLLGQPAGGVELPFQIRGPWHDPVVVPNPEALTRRSSNEPPPQR